MTHEALISPEDFKLSMQLLTSSVAVITSSYEGVRCGMTATAVCSLTADPPSLLVCVNRNAHTYSPIMDSRKFCVNILAQDQADVAQVFAGSSDDPQDKFLRAGTWTASSSGMPVLEGCLLSFSCRVEKWLNTKTHAALVGLIHEVRVNADADALLYARRQFTSVQPAPASLATSA